MANRYNVLFVCTGNAARSIMAEAILSHVGMGRFAAYSAGSHPAAGVNPEAVRQMELAQMDGDAYRPKSWEMFAWPGTPRMDFVITLCDVAAGRPQPKFPGNPISVYWQVPDPEVAEGSREEIGQAFGAAFGMLNEKIRRMVALPAVKRGKEALGRELERTGMSVRRLAAEELIAGAAVELQPDAEAETVSEAGLAGELIPA
jgi:arsenate reductase (thioredoxin)